MTSMAAKAAAQAIGLPPVVVVCMKGFGSITLQIFAVEKKPLQATTPPPRALPKHMMSGVIPE